MSMTRRSALLALGGTALGRAAKPAVSTGLELYSFRREMKKDVRATLAQTRQLGFSEVEVPGLYGLTATAFRAELDRAGLRCTAMVIDKESIRSGVQPAVDCARTLGADYVIYPWLDHSDSFGAKDCARAVDSFNRWGDEFKAAGLRFCYHPHGYEFGPSPEGTLLDTMIQRTTPGAVDYQMDIFWIVWPGQDPVQFLRRYPGRFPLMHLKDVRTGVKGNQTGIAPDEVSVAIGSGSTKFPAIFLEADKAGVKRYYIEDESPEAPEQVPASLRYLASIGR